MRFKTPELVQWAEKVFAQEGVICFDIHANKRGAIDPDHIRQVRAVREVLDKKEQITDISGSVFKLIRQKNGQECIQR